MTFDPSRIVYNLSKHLGFQMLSPSPKFWRMSSSITLQTVPISKQIERFPCEDARQRSANLVRFFTRLDVDEVAVVLDVTDDVYHF